MVNKLFDTSAINFFSFDSKNSSNQVFNSASELNKTLRKLLNSNQKSKNPIELNLGNMEDVVRLPN